MAKAHSVGLAEISMLETSVKGILKGTVYKNWRMEMFMKEISKDQEDGARAH